MSEATQENIVVKDHTEPMGESSVKRKKGCRQQQRQSLQARIKFRDLTVKGIRKHLQRGTFPKRFKALRPYPKMETPESQAIVNAACEQVHRIILDQVAVEEELKLKQDRIRYEALTKKQDPPKKPTILQLQQELKELQSKYTELCNKLDFTQ